MQASAVELNRPATPQLPVVTLLGNGFLSAANLRLGWAFAWRVGLADALVSGVAHGTVAVLRGSVTLDIVDSLLLFGTTTITGLLIADWVGRRLARRFYQIGIQRFIGWEIMWRQLVASIAWGSATAVLAGGGFLLLRMVTSDDVLRSGLPLSTTDSNCSWTWYVLPNRR